MNHSPLKKLVFRACPIVAVLSAVLLPGVAFGETSVLQINFDKLAYKPGEPVTVSVAWLGSGPTTVMKSFRQKDTSDRTTSLFGCYALPADNPKSSVEPCALTGHSELFKLPLAPADDLVGNFVQGVSGSHEFSAFNIPPDASEAAIWVVAELNFHASNLSPNLHQTAHGWTRLTKQCTGGKPPTALITCTYVTPRSFQVNAASKLQPKTFPKPKQ